MAPLAVDIYSRFMTEAFDERELIGVPTGFQAFFGRPENGSRTIYSPDADIVTIDIIRGNEKLAATILRGSTGRVISGEKATQAQKFSNFDRVFPLIEETGAISSSQLTHRLAGEQPFASGTNRSARLRALAMEHHVEHVRRVARTFEYLSSQSVLTGKQPAIIGTTNTDLIYDFKRLATHQITVTNKWNSGSQTIMADIDGACDTIREDAHVMPDVAIVGSSAMGAFLEDADIQKLADNRRFVQINIDSQMQIPAKYERFVRAGFQPRGKLITSAGYELMLFSYVDVYTDSSGNPQKYMPVDKMVIASTESRADRYFGPPDVLPMTPSLAQWYQETFGFAPGAPPMPPNIKDAGEAISPAMFYFDGYPRDDNKGVTIRTQAAPIFATTHTDGFAVLQGLV